VDWSCIIRRAHQPYLYVKEALYRARDSGRERYMGEGSCATCTQVAQRVRVGHFVTTFVCFPLTLIRRATRLLLPLGEGK